MIAKFKGYCFKCRKPVYPGQEIDYDRNAEKGQMTAHKVCPVDGVKAKPADTNGYREIAARFQSVCAICQDVIAEGERIMWKKGEKAMHVACYGQFVVVNPEVVVDDSKPASREEQRARYDECGPNAWDDRDNFDTYAPENADDDFDF